MKTCSLVVVRDNTKMGDLFKSISDKAGAPDPHIYYLFADAIRSYREERENGNNMDNPPHDPFEGAPDLEESRGAAPSAARYGMCTWPGVDKLYRWALDTNSGITRQYCWRIDRKEPLRNGSEIFWFSIVLATDYVGGIYANIPGFCLEQKSGTQSGSPSYEFRFSDEHSPAVRKWMEEKDFNYLKRIRKENQIILFRDELIDLNTKNRYHPAIARIIFDKDIALTYIDIDQKKLHQIFDETTEFKTLYLSRQNIDDTRVPDLLVRFMDISSLERIYLDHNFLTIHGVERLLKRLIVEEESYYDLLLMGDLPEHGIPEQGKIYLARDSNKLKYLTITQEKMVVEGFLKSDDLCNINFDRNEFLKFIGGLTKESLDVHKDQILKKTSERGHTQLNLRGCPHPSLHHLSLVGNRIDVFNFNYRQINIRQNSKIQSVDLSLNFMVRLPMEDKKYEYMFLLALLRILSRRIPLRDMVGIKIIKGSPEKLKYKKGAEEVEVDIDNTSKKWIDDYQTISREKNRNESGRMYDFYAAASKFFENGGAFSQVLQENVAIDGLQLGSLQGIDQLTPRRQKIIARNLLNPDWIPIYNQLSDSRFIFKEHKFPYYHDWIEPQLEFPSLLVDDFIVTCDRWIVYLMATKEKDHAVLGLEGLFRHGQRFFMRAELFANGLIEVTEGVNQGPKYANDKFEYLKSSHDIAAYYATKLEVKAIVKSVAEDKVGYKKVGCNSSAQEPEYNCLTWVIKKIRMTKTGHKLYSGVLQSPVQRAKDEAKTTHSEALKNFCSCYPHQASEGIVSRPPTPLLPSSFGNSASASNASSSLGNHECEYPRGSRQSLTRLERTSSRPLETSSTESSSSSSSATLQLVSSELPLLPLPPSSDASSSLVYGSGYNGSLFTPTSPSSNTSPGSSSGSSSDGSSNALDLSVFLTSRTGGQKR